MRLFGTVNRRMRTSLRRRIGRRTARRLLDGVPAGQAYVGLANLLDAAAARARPEEFAGERAALAAFAAAYRGVALDDSVAERAAALDAAVFAGDAASVGGRTGWVAGEGRIRRILLTKTVVVATVVFVAGTTLAAETGALPNPIQKQAHRFFSDVGVPAPDSRSDSSARRPARASPAPPTPEPTPPASAPAESPVELCRAWTEAQKDPHGKAMRDERLHALAIAAGGSASIPTFCAKTLEAVPTRSPEGEEPESGEPESREPESGKPESGKPESGKSESGEPASDTPSRSGNGGDPPNGGAAPDQGPPNGGVTSSEARRDSGGNRSGVRGAVRAHDRRGSHHPCQGRSR